MLKVMIVDNEATIRKGLVHCIRWEDLGCVVAAQAADGIDALEQLPLVRPDILISDIRMPGMDGLETARQLRQNGSRALLVFVTVLGECVFDAFEVQAFDFLLKPPDPSRFRRMMARAMAALGPGDSLVVQRGNACRVVGFSELAYCEVQGRKIFLHLCDGSLVDYYGRMDALEKRLDGRFFRCHRSYLVNLDCVRGCGNGQAALAQGGSVPVSRLREGGFSNALLRRMRERGR